MLLSKDIIRKARTRFDELIGKVGEAKRNEIVGSLNEIKDGDVADMLVWLYAYSPISDMANYGFEFFRSFAEHGVFLRRLRKIDVPDDIFLSYVAHPRMGGEELCDCRKFFYDLLNKRVEGKSEKDAIIELNYFNAENVKYVTTDYRTLSALATYNSTYGRCGEESVFAVNVFRSLGIPARQIYTPRWAHCDDNHAWIEVWCDGDWHFLGACEPEEVLDRGWFMNAVGRAMLVQCRTFGETNEEVLSRTGIGYLVNDLQRYAPSKMLKVRVTDESGKPKANVKVAIGILNHSHIFPCAIFLTDESGSVTFNCGLGSLNIRVMSGDISLEKLVYTPDVDEVEFALVKERPNFDVWQDFISIAPKDGAAKGNKPTEEQKELCRLKTAAANEKREQRAKAMFDEKRAKAIVEKFGYHKDIFEKARESRGNCDNILSFLEDERFSPSEKEGALRFICFKDLRDINVDVLREAIEVSREYQDKYDDETYFKYVVCPRVWFEWLTVNRRFILNYFTNEQKENFRTDPRLIWKYIVENIAYYPEFELGQTITNPVGLLTVKSGHPMSHKILFVVICRTLGIAARLNPVNMLAEYYDGEFISVETKQDEGDCTLILKKEGSWNYLTDFAVGVLEGGDYVNLELENREWEGDEMRIKLKSGEYRILTDNRLPNGNILASKYNFTLCSGSVKQIELHRHEAKLSDMLLGYSFDDFAVTDTDGKEVRASELLRKRTVMIWLGSGEPTEHILNEMIGNIELFKSLPCAIAFMLKDKKALLNEKVAFVLKSGNAKAYFDEINSQPLARRMFLDPEKLPLIVIAKDLKADYASAGYNFGSGDMIIKICNMLKEKK